MGKPLEAKKIENNYFLSNLGTKIWNFGLVRKFDWEFDWKKRDQKIHLQMVQINQNIALISLYHKPGYLNKLLNHAILPYSDENYFLFPN